MTFGGGTNEIGSIKKKVSEAEMVCKGLSGLIALVLFGSVFSMACDRTPKPDDYQPKVLAEARVWKSKIESDIQVAVKEIQKVASSLETIRGKNTPNRDDANHLIKQVLEANENYLAIWTLWEPNAFDNKDAEYQNKSGHDESGRFMPYWNRQNGKINVVSVKNNHSQYIDPFYRQLVIAGKEMVSDPIEYTVNGNRDLKVIYAVPIYHEERIIGAAGIDLPLLGFFKPIIRQVRVLDVAYGILIDNNGVLTAHPTKWANVGKSLEFFMFEKDVIQAVKEGREAFQLKVSKTTGRESFYQFVPIQIGSSNRPWSLAISLIPDWLDGSGPKVTW